MANLNDPEVKKLLEEPNHAVISTHNPDDSILNTVVWINTENGAVAVNSAVGRKWPSNLERDPRTSRCSCMEQNNPLQLRRDPRHSRRHRRGRRRAHQRAHEEVHQPGRVPVSPARRAADQVRDHAGPHPAPEAGLERLAPAASAVAAAALLILAGLLLELTLDAVELGRRAVQPPAVAQHRDQHDEQHPDRPEAARSRRDAAQIAGAHARTAAAPPPASWITRRCSSLRRATSSALRC